jgi:CheY-specific phosphatase CheX
LPCPMLTPVRDAASVSEAVSPDTQALKDKLKELVRYAAASRLKIHTGSAEVETIEMGSGFRPGRILASNMVFILVSGDALRLTFKAHFNIRTARNLAFRIFGGNSPAAISENQAIDYFKEYGNLVAGSVVTLLGKSGVESGISLPLSTRGFYEVFSDYSEKHHPAITFSDFWELRSNGCGIHCCALLEILNRRQLANLGDHELVEEADNDDGEMDFL